MQQTLCLWLAVAVLLAALVVGNPFRSASPDGVAAPHRQGALPPVREAPGASGRLVGGMAPAVDGGGLEMGSGLPAVAVQSTHRAPEAVNVVALRAIEPAATGSLECPDPELRAHVRDVEWVGSEPVWVLDDGRRVMKNRRVGPGEPLVVEWAPGTRSQ